MPEAQITFYLSPEEHRRMQKLIATATTTVSPRWYTVTTILYALEMSLAISLHRDAWRTAFYVLSFALWAAMAIRYFRIRQRRVPVEGSLRLCATGLAGTLDRKPATIGWSDIATVRDLDDAIVLLRRRNLSAVAIPKASIADVAALWALLEDRLISKRGLILSAAPRRQIANSAY